MSAPAGPRWAQLTYTSFDDDASRGGWQIKQRTGNPDDNEVLYLRSRVSTQFSLATPLPSFPLDEEIAALPRRLVYAGEDVPAGHWHTVPAGPDATGRPGNVFAQMLLDRRPGVLEPQLRPIELWRSPDWLTPYGPDQVRDAVLRPGDLPRAGAAVTVDSVLDFVLDPDHWRTGVLCVLLDAVALSRTPGGLPVVLGVASPDDAALWFGALSFLMSAQCARRVSFSTYERSDSLEAVWGRGVRLTAVPQIDLREIDIARATVLDGDEVVGLGVVETAPHTTGAGSEITATAWSMLTEVVLQDRELARQVLADLDVFAGQISTVGTSIAWPLAAAMARHETEFEDVADEIGTVLVDKPPADLHRLPEIEALVERTLQGTIGDTAAAIWDRLPTLEDRYRPFAAGEYLRRAVADAGWLAGPSDVPARSLLGLDPAPALAAAAAALAERSQGLLAAVGTAGDRIASAVQVIQLASFIGRLSHLGPLPDADRTLAVLADAVVAPVAVDPQAGPSLVVAAGPLPEESTRQLVRAAVLRRLATTEPAPAGGLGERVSRPVLAWVHDNVLPVGGESEPDALELEWLVSMLRTTTSRSAERARLAPRALDAGLAVGPPLRWLVEELAGEPYRPADVARLVGRFGWNVPARIVYETVRAAHWDKDVAWLVATIDALPEIEFDGVDLSRTEWARASRSIAVIRSAAHGVGGTLTMATSAPALLERLEESQAWDRLRELDHELAVPVVVSAAMRVLRRGEPQRGARIAPRGHRAGAEPGGRSVGDPPKPLVYGTSSYLKPPATPVAPTAADATAPAVSPSGLPAALPSLDRPPTPRAAPRLNPSPLLSQSTRLTEFWQAIDRLAGRADPQQVRQLLRRAVASRSIDLVKAIEVALFYSPEFPYGGEFRRTPDEQRLARITIADSGRNAPELLVAGLAAAHQLPFGAKDVDELTLDLMHRPGVAAPDRTMQDECVQAARERWKALTASDRGRNPLRRGR